MRCNYSFILFQLLIVISYFFFLQGHVNMILFLLGSKEQLTPGIVSFMHLNFEKLYPVHLHVNLIGHQGPIHLMTESLGPIHTKHHFYIIVEAKEIKERRREWGMHLEILLQSLLGELLSDLGALVWTRSSLNSGLPTVFQIFHHCIALSSHVYIQ